MWAHVRWIWLNCWLFGSLLGHLGAYCALIGAFSARLAHNTRVESTFSSGFRQFPIDLYWVSVDFLCIFVHFSQHFTIFPSFCAHAISVHFY